MGAFPSCVDDPCQETDSTPPPGPRALCAGPGDRFRGEDEEKGRSRRGSRVAGSHPDSRHCPDPGGWLSPGGRRPGVRTEANVPVTLPGSAVRRGPRVQLDGRDHVVPVPALLVAEH